MKSFRLYSLVAAFALAVVAAFGSLPTFADLDLELASAAIPAAHAGAPPPLIAEPAPVLTVAAPADIEAEGLVVADTYPEKIDLAPGIAGASVEEAQEASPGRSSRNA